MINVPLRNDAYYEGRLEPVELVVLHTAECDCLPGLAVAIAGFLANTQPPDRASCHYVTDPETTVSQVAEKDTAWTAPGANANGINIEQTGWANRAHPTDWASPLALKMLKTQTVPLVADICKRWGIPAVLLEPSDLLAGKRGITDHVRVNGAFHRSDHYDCGANYPLAQVVLWVKELLDGNPVSPSPSTQNDEDMLNAFMIPNDATIYIRKGATGKVWRLQDITPGGYDPMVCLQDMVAGLFCHPLVHIDFGANAVIAATDGRSTTP